jgi:hypothetical protein
MVLGHNLEENPQRMIAINFVYIGSASGIFGGHFIVPTLYMYAKMYWGVIADLCVHFGKNIILVIVILVFYIVVVHVLVSFNYLN